MAVRLFIFIALSANIFILICDAGDTGSSSSSESNASQSEVDITNNYQKASKRKCTKVKKCPKNEEFSYCTQSISRAQYCSQKGQMIRQQENTECIEGCVCKVDFLRNYNGTCVPESKCGDDCGPNEVLEECPVDCASQYCPTSDKEPSTCDKSDDESCPPPACKCRFNYRRANNGICIPTRNCPPFPCTKPNEQYTPCPPFCPSDACSLPRVTGVCPFRIGIILECNPKCQCKDGYGRSNGVCVPFKDCPNLCPVNEEYDCCTQAVCRPQTCADRHKPALCAAVDENSCKKGCVCKENFYRNANGTCVIEDQCKDDKCSEPNEEYTTSRVPHCPVLDTCVSLVARIACDQPEVPGCVCKGGYKRLNETSPCIPICKCPQLSSTMECQSSVS